MARGAAAQARGQRAARIDGQETNGSLSAIGCQGNSLNSSLASFLLHIFVHVRSGSERDKARCDAVSAAPFKIDCSLKTGLYLQLIGLKVENTKFSQQNIYLSVIVSQLKRCTFKINCMNLKFHTFGAFNTFLDSEVTSISSEEDLHK